MTLSRPAAVAGLLLAAACSFSAQAQQIFRIVGPDGKVTFSDRPPEDPKAPPPSKGFVIPISLR